MTFSGYVPPEIAGLHCVGWVSAAHGIRGELYVRLNAGQADWSDDVEELTLVKRNTTEPLRFAIQKLSAHKEGLIIKLDGVRDRNAAELLAKSSVYIDEELLEAEEGDAIFLKQIENFTVLEKDGNVIGRIVGFATNGVQDLLRVKTAQGEALVPLVDDFLLGIDFDKKEVRMDLPPGLLDVDLK